MRPAGACRGRRAVGLEPGFAVLVVTEGALTLETATGVLDLSRGTTALAPHSAGPLRLTGRLPAAPTEAVILGESRVCDQFVGDYWYCGASPPRVGSS